MKTPKSDKPKKSDFTEFLKKRAPIYLGLMGLFLIFIVPEITQGTLQGIMPDDFTLQQQEIIDVLFAHVGQDGKGSTLVDVLSENIESKYSNEKIYSHKDTKIDVLIDQFEGDIFKVEFTISTYKEDLLYIWHVNPDTKQVNDVNSNAKNIIGKLDYS